MSEVSRCDVIDVTLVKGRPLVPPSCHQDVAAVMPRLQAVLRALDQNPSTADALAGWNLWCRLSGTALGFQLRNEVPARLRQGEWSAAGRSKWRC
ncbi:unnamed protein product [Lota lota]